MASENKLLPVIKNPCLLTCYAKRNSGKSHLLKHLLKDCMKRKQFQWIIVFSATKFNGEWSDIVGEKCVYDDFNPDMVNALLANQAKLVKKKKAKPGLLLFDDMIGTANFKSDIISKIAIASRHFLISVWITAQFPTKMPPLIRQNSDYSLVLNSVNERIARLIYEEFPTTFFKSWKEVEAYFNENTKNYGCILIDNKQECHYSVIRAPNTVAKFKIQMKR
jgi:hypothetical protein